MMFAYSFNYFQFNRFECHNRWNLLTKPRGEKDGDGFGPEFRDVRPVYYFKY